MKQKKPVEKVSRTKLMELLGKLEGNGNTFVSVMATTEPRMRKTDNPMHGNVKKTRSVTGCLGYDYEANVNAQRDREDKAENFVAQASSWGTRVGNSCLIVHRPKKATVDKFYLDLRVLRTIRARYFTVDNGQRIPFEAVKSFLYKRNNSAKQNLRKEIVINRFAIDNIRRINVGIPGDDGKVQKRRFIVVDDKE